MNPKHAPVSSSSRRTCPVCHQSVYSRGGIHPQCAVRQSEPPRPGKADPTAAAEAVAEKAK